MKKIYQNYNSVYLVKEKGREIIVKKFRYEFTWKNETKVIQILKNFNFPVPEILESTYLENKYTYFKMKLFSEAIAEDKKRIYLLLDLLRDFYYVSSSEFFSFDRKDDLTKTAMKLFEEKKIDSSLIEKIERIASRYPPNKKGFVHGDFRLDNFFYFEGKVGGIIDLEFSGIDDPHKDLAYLWVDTVRHDKTFNHFLKKEFKRFDYFNDLSFIFWLTYVHLMIMANPKNKFYAQWKKNLEYILREF